MAKTVLALQNMVKRYGATLGVGPIDFAVEEGEFLTLLGPSGCGKTTTLHVIAGLLFPDEGKVLMGGRDISNVDPPHRDMGLVFQNYALFPHKTVFDNVAFGLRMRKVPREEIRARVHRILEVVGLPGIERRYPDQLSGGQRQRVALARALVIEPTVLLLDEPLSNLDAVLRKRMRLDLREIQQRLGITTIFVTHDQDEAFEMSDRVVLLNHGRIEQIGSPEELYDSPASGFAAEFIGETNLLQGRVVQANGAGLRVEAAHGAVYELPTSDREWRPGDPVYLMVRPERIEITQDKPEGGASVSARVAKRVFSGDLLAFTLAGESNFQAICTKPSIPAYRAIQPGDQVWVRLGDWRLLPRDDA